MIRPLPLLAALLLLSLPAQAANAPAPKPKAEKTAPAVEESAESSEDILPPAEGDQAAPLPADEDTQGDEE